MITNFIIWLIGLVFLIVFSLIDYYTREVENNPILMFFVFGVMCVLFIEKSVLVGVLMLVTAIIGWYMYKNKIIGGADVKILPSMMPFMLIGSANYIVTYMNFLVVFGCVGASYALLYKNFIGKRRKYIPFVPAILITYILTALLIIK